MGVDFPGQLLYLFGESGVGLQESLQVGCLMARDLLALCARLGKGFAMSGIGLAQSFVPVCLAGLGKEDQRSRVRSLKRESEIQEDERIRVPPKRYGCDVDDDPQANQHRLSDQESRRAKESGEGLGSTPEIVGAEGPVQGLNASMKARCVVGH
jgi:hypothetical protein